MNVVIKMSMTAERARPIVKDHCHIEKEDINNRTEYRTVSSVCAPYIAE